MSQGLALGASGLLSLGLGFRASRPGVRIQGLGFGGYDVRGWGGDLLSRRVDYRQVFVSRKLLYDWSQRAGDAVAS